MYNSHGCKTLQHEILGKLKNLAKKEAWLYKQPIELNPHFAVTLQVNDGAQW
jgi:hypothetical protein